MIKRFAENKIKELINNFPCVAIIGPRQVGKTTLAKQIIASLKNEYEYIDLELQRDAEKLTDPETYFLSFPDKNFVIDEVQQNKKLFPVLRAIIDRDRRPGRFILLGSASPDLLRDSSESLAGRIAYYELTPFLIEEIDKKKTLEDLWFYGGFPDAILKNLQWADWMNNYIRTYFERDLVNLGLSADSNVSKRLWYMLAHSHGNLINFSDYAKSLELSGKTIKNYIHFFDQAFLVRELKPYYFNLKKRLVKSPKIYIRDSGLLHYILGLEKPEDLFGHPKMGASWEGFVIEQILSRIKMNRQTYFFRTHNGAELDLVIEKGGVPVAGIEIKYGSKFTPSRGNTEAVETLSTQNNFIIVKDEEDFMHKNFRICGIRIFLEKYLPDI
jgi:predicted AAA+ superfamily ATPase